MRRKSSDLPEYTVVKHPRAKHVRLKLSLQGKLEIIVPKNYDLRGIPGVIRDKRPWLDQAEAQLQRQRQDLPADHFAERPVVVRLRAIDERFRVTYKLKRSDSIELLESGAMLTLSGPVNDLGVCVDALQGWLRDKARESMAPWLERTSRRLELPYKRVSIRGQKTRWGSCTAQKVINLNYKLLFLPRRQVYYVLVHELCHTKCLSHSQRYWSIVESKLPDYMRYEQELRTAWRYVPLWASPEA
ncbi:MAG: M48 family metallopeptidase [Gammaproteobacteria bacterium]